MVVAISDGDIESFTSGSWRWTLCFAAILALHVAGLCLALTFWRNTEPLPAGAPPLALLELAPLPVAPPVVTPAPPPEPPPLPLEEAAPLTPATVVPVPVPPKPKPMRRPPLSYEPPAIMAAPSPPVAAPPTSAPPVVVAQRPSNAVPNWQSALLARLEQFKRYPSLAQFRHQEGTVKLTFIMDRQGRVLSAQIAKSSGYDSLDDEALALVRRAEPLPAPPAEMPGPTLSLTVPVQFFLK